MRIIANFSEDPLWINAFKEGGDLHSILCSKVFDIPIENVKTPSSFKPDLIYRDIAKTINFGFYLYLCEQLKQQEMAEVKPFKVGEPLTSNTAGNPEPSLSDKEGVETGRRVRIATIKCRISVRKGTVRTYMKI